MPEIDPLETIVAIHASQKRIEKAFLGFIQLGQGRSPYYIALRDQQKGLEDSVQTTRGELQTTE